MSLHSHLTFQRTAVRKPFYSLPQNPAAPLHIFFHRGGHSAFRGERQTRPFIRLDCLDSYNMLYPRRICQEISIRRDPACPGIPVTILPLERGRTLLHVIMFRGGGDSFDSLRISWVVDFPPTLTLPRERLCRNSSCPRRRAFRPLKTKTISNTWIPAFAGMTTFFHLRHSLRWGREGRE
jgi:hypothetical protein